MGFITSLMYFGIFFFQHDYDVSAYTVERTLDMEKRADILKKLKLNQRRPTVRLRIIRYLISIIN